MKVKEKANFYVSYGCMLPPRNGGMQGACYISELTSSLVRAKDAPVEPT